MKYKHTIYALLYLAALAVVSYAFPACTREEMSGRLEIFYTGVTDIAPSQEVIIDAPTYRGETPGNFEITGITLNGEPFSTESIRINDTATGEILVTETENLPVGTYLVSIACTSGGRRYEFPDIIQVEMLMPVPDGISVEPAEVTVNLADLNIDSPTAKVVVDERKSIRVKRYSLIQENSWFEVSGDGVISVNPEYEDEILAGDYRLDLKIETDLGKALFEDAVLFHIVSAPKSITYHGSGMMIESGEEHVFEVSMMNGSAEALEYTLVSVTPALENAGDIVLDPHSGAVTVARGNSLVREEEYAVTVKASNVYGETVFESALTFTAVGHVAEITEFSYRSQNIPQFESYTFGVDRMDGSYVQYSLKNVPETLSGLLSIDADSGEITLSDNNLSPGVYYVTVTAENIKGSMDASFRLAIVKHPYHFDDVRYSSGQNAEYSLLPDVNAFSYTKLAVMQADVLTPEIIGLDTDDEVEITYEYSLKTTLPFNSGSPQMNGRGVITFDSVANYNSGYGCSVIFVKVTVSGTEGQYSKTVPVFIRLLQRKKMNNGEYVTVDYAPFVVKMNPATGGRSAAPTITKDEAAVTDYTGFLMNFRRNFNFYSFDEEYMDGGSAVTNSFTNLLWTQYGRSASGDNDNALVSYYNTTLHRAKTDIELESNLLYIDGRTMEIVVNPGMWYDEKYGNYANGVFMASLVADPDGVIENINDDGSGGALAGNLMHPVVIWFSEEF